jgi:hypothetical protein
MDFSRSLAGHGSRYTWDTVPMSGAPRLNGLPGNSRHAQGKGRGYGFFVRRERLSELRPSMGDHASALDLIFAVEQTGRHVPPRRHR